jgi:rare lipoprotein A (peptidoglycan hydrolase)
MHVHKLVLLIASAILATGTCAYAQPLDPVPTERTSMHHRVTHVQRGKISWYGGSFAGRKTASGERFDPRAMTMAHRWWPLGTIVLVINDDNGRRATLRVNDRGPYRDGRVADVSRAASLRLGFAETGLADATLEVLWMPSSGANDADAAGLTSRG